MIHNIEIVKPEEIEKKSMEIIESEMKVATLERYHKGELKVLKRCIHTSADFEYEENLVFSEQAFDTMMQALKNKAIIITDTNMAFSGISKVVTKRYGIDVYCFMADEDIAKAAKERGQTRATLCMEKARDMAKEHPDRPVIIAVGNAPTALIKLYDMHKNKEFTPDMIIAVPVGFVNVVEAKELILSSNMKNITARGRKGGSNIAAAIINAFLYQLDQE